jgi:hypothetical protein
MTTEPIECMQAVPDCAFLFFVAQVFGGPDADR